MVDGEIPRKRVEMKRTKICPICGKHFSYEIASGNDRVYCWKKCYEIAHKRKQIERLSLLPECKTEGCNNKATRVGHGVCESCYYRIRRNGNAQKRVPSYRYITGAGYIKLLKPEHPLADSSGDVYEHRMIVYDILKGSMPACYWCGTALEWSTAVIDHLNENKKDNDKQNLVVSCNNCNRSRGAMLPMIKNLREEALETFINQIRIYHKKEST
jgi:hypothetical protein